MIFLGLSHEVLRALPSIFCGMSGAFPTGFCCQGQEISFSEGKYPNFQASFSFVFSFFLPSGPQGQGASLTSLIAQPLPQFHTTVHLSILAHLPCNSLGLSVSKSLGKTKIWGLPFNFTDQRIPVPVGFWWPVPQTGSNMRPPPILRAWSVDRQV